MSNTTNIRMSNIMKSFLLMGIDMLGEVRQSHDMDAEEVVEELGIKTVDSISEEMGIELSDGNVSKFMQGATRGGANILMKKIIGDSEVDDLDDGEAIVNVELSDIELLSVVSSVRSLIAGCIFDRKELHRSACSLMGVKYECWTDSEFVHKFASVFLAMYDMLESSMAGDVAKEWRRQKMETSARVLYSVDSMCSSEWGNDNDKDEDT